MGLAQHYITELKKSNKKLTVLFYYLLEDIFDN